MKETKESNSAPKRLVQRDIVRKLLLDVFKHRIVGGDRLKEQHLAQRFGVSRTPIRDALAALGAIGMVQIKPNCGVEARPFGPVQLREIFHIRGVLEAEAARLACCEIPTDELEKLQKELRDLTGTPKNTSSWVKRAVSVDKLLHSLITGNCGNQRLIEEISRYRELIEAIREAIKNRFSIFHQIAGEHLAIVDALLEKDADKSAVAMRKHIDKTAEVAVSIMFNDSEKE